MPVIIVRISGTCFLIDNMLGTQGKGNLTFSSQVNFLSKQFNSSQPCSEGFTPLHFKTELIAIEEILHHYSTLNFKTACLFLSQFPPTCFKLDDHFHISKISVQGF